LGAARRYALKGKGRHYVLPSDVRLARERRVFASGFAWGALTALAVAAALAAAVLWGL